MENILDDEIEYKTINKIKALYFEINYPTIKIINQPKFKKWLESQKMERGNNGYVGYCQKCNLFFYFVDKMEEINTNCGYDHYFGKICNDCGEIYDNYSYWCIKKGIIGTLKEILFDGYYCSGSGIFTKIKLIPFIFIYFFSWSIIFGIFFNRKKKINNNMFANYIFNANCRRNLTIIIADLIVFLHSLIFMITFQILYISGLIFIIIQSCREE